ncbi:DUF983 domain-containing protein [Micromonospora sp. STR1s_5]|nr:DUF983 domain-containing protein [Micromonospora sp. STR1s_5]
MITNQPIISTGLRCRCPKCGQGKLFDGFLTLKPRCEVCGLDYSFADPADGPAFFVMMTMAIPATAFGLWIELAYEPAFWVHLVTTIPFLLLSCIPPIRPLKGLLVASQFVHKAEETRFAVPKKATSDQPRPQPAARRLSHAVQTAARLRMCSAAPERPDRLRPEPAVARQLSLRAQTQKRPVCRSRRAGWMGVRRGLGDPAERPSRDDVPPNTSVRKPVERWSGHARAFPRLGRRACSESDGCTSADLPSGAAATHQFPERSGSGALRSTGSSAADAPAGS